MRTLLSIVSISLLLSISVAGQQQKFTISGSIKDAKNGEDMIGVVVAIKELPNVAVATNEYGYFSLSIPQGKYSISIQYIGYDNISQEINLDKSTKIDFKLKEKSQQIDEVVVTSVRENENVTQNQMGVTKIDMKSIEKIPVLFGERDVLKTIQLTPGIKSAGEGQSGFFVRGGGVDQNMILLDEAVVYNPSHLLGFFSVFNSDAIKDVNIYKGTAGAQYGGRLSSVLDMRMKEGNNQRYSVSGGIGLISSRIAVEGPIVKDKGSFIITGRRTYADLFLKLSSNEDLKNTQLYFYDMNLKANYRLGKNDRLFLSGYFGRDKLAFTSFGIGWGNYTGTLRWNHVFSDKLFSNTSMIVSNYNYQIKVGTGTAETTIDSDILDFNLKQDFQYYLNTSNTFKFGLNSVYHSMIPGKVTQGSSSSLNTPSLTNRYGWENALYFSNEQKFGTRFTLEYGLRLSSFSQIGGKNFYSFDANGNVTDTSQTSQINYINPEPRLSATYKINESSSLKGSYTRNAQYMHLLSNSTGSNPTDIWVLSSQNIKAGISDQVSVGWYKNFKEDKYEFSVEGYYKAMQNQIDYRNGAETRANELVEGDILAGVGRAYGLEFYLRKKTGRFTGWASYTLSRTERQIDGINDNKWYLAKQDRTHEISLVGMYEVNKKWSVSATATYYTGNAITFPSGKYEVDGKTTYYYTERNGYRMPFFFRLDLGATYMIKKTDTRESSLSFSIYNATNRYNAYSISFRDKEGDATRTEAVQTTLFGIIPSISWNFKF
ncbi:MAG: TonB-dependent receptor [Bacteroidetes bacterium]|nr:MAG: TonB-dependent receptor [Bacteroidota bacterium]